LIDLQIEFFFPQILLIPADTLLDFSFGKNLRKSAKSAGATLWRSRKSQCSISYSTNYK
jgi:hypothetical protein